MKKLLNAKLVLAVLGAVFFTSCTIKTTENNRRTVSVSGTGSVEVEADNATIILSVITRGKDVGNTAKENAEKMTKVHESVLALGILPEDVSTEHYTINQESNYLNGKVIYGDYVATNRIKIFIKDLTMAGNVIDAAIKAGANQLSSFQYGISNKESFVKQARTLAVQNARDTANLLATTSGAFLGKVISLNEQSNNFGFYRVNAKRASLEAAVEDTASSFVSTPISGGKTTISFTVDAVFEIK